MRIALLIILAGTAPGALCSVAAEEQSWSKRTPPPVRFAPPSPEQKTQDWSGFHMGVNAGSSFRTDRDSALPPTLNLPR